MIDEMPHYVLREDYISDQLHLQKSIEDELHQTERSVNTLRDELKSFENRATTQFNSINQKFDAIDQRFESVEAILIETRADVQRSLAQNHNSRIRNPLQPIHPVISFNPNKGIIKPDLTLYPKHSNEFYALRNPTTDRKQRMLEYLVSFYDLTHVYVPDTEANDEAMSHPQLAVQYLETILGLDETSIKQFRERAQMFDRDQRFLQPFKRGPVESEEIERQVQRQKLEIRTSTTDQPQLVNLEQAKSKSPETNLSSQSAKLQWDTRSTPSSKKAINRGIQEYMEDQRLGKKKTRKDQDQQRRRDGGEEKHSSPDDEEDNKSPSAELEDDPTANSGTTTNPNTPRIDSN